MNNQTADSELENGTPDLSGQEGSNSSGQQNSPDVNVLVGKLLEHPLFTKAVEEMAERKAQAMKDRRFSKIENENVTFREQLAKLKELQEEGWSEKQALRMLEVEQPILKQEPATPERKADTQPQAANTEAMRTILATLGLDPNEPKVIDTMRITGDDLTRMQALITIAADKKVKQSQPANPAAAVVPTGGNVTTNKQELTKKLQEVLSNPLSTDKEIAEAKTRLKEALARSV